MTVNRTTLLDLPIITTGTESGAWGNITNNGLSQYMDIAIAGMTSLTSANFTAGALTIANTQGDSSATNIAAGSAQYATIKVSSLAANSTITAPSSNRAYRIINADGTYTLTIKASGQTGVTFPINTSGIVVFNGTDYVLLGSYVIASAGTASLPSITTTGDTNTGIYFPAADTIAFTEGGVESMRIDSSGNLGLGVTPSAWSGYGVPVIEAPAGGTFVSAGNGNIIGSNWYYTGSNFVYKTTNAASYTYQVNGQHRWLTAPSGTAGNAISFTQAMTLDASGALGIGNTSPSTYDRLVVSNALATTGTGLVTPNGLTLQNTNATAGNYTTIQNLDSGGGQNAQIQFINVTHGSPFQGAIAFTTRASTSDFAERARITSGGDLLVGTTAQISGSSSRLVLDYATADYVSTLRNSNASPYGLLIRYSTDTNNSTNYFITAIGDATSRFVVASNGNVTNTNNSYGAISDVKLKENITDATPKLEKLNQVRIVNFNMIGEEQKQLGVIAQEIEQIFPGMVEESPDRDKDGNDLGTTTKSVKYSVFVPMLIKAIQEQQALIQSLTARVAALEGTQP